jgi:hypothetical protein
MSDGFGEGTLQPRERRRTYRISRLTESQDWSAVVLIGYTRQSLPPLQ